MKLCGTTDEAPTNARQIRIRHPPSTHPLRMPLHEGFQLLRQLGGVVFAVPDGGGFGEDLLADVLRQHAPAGEHAAAQPADEHFVLTGIFEHQLLRGSGCGFRGFGHRYSSFNLRSFGATRLSYKASDLRRLPAPNLSWPATAGHPVDASSNIARR